MHTAAEHLLIIPGRSPFAMVLYPVIPWLGITTFGIFWAQMLRKVPEQIYKLSLITGLIFIAFFIVLRLLEMGNFNIAKNDSWVNFCINYPWHQFITSLFVFNFSFQQLAATSQNFWADGHVFYIIHLYLFVLISTVFPIGCTVKMMSMVWIFGLIALYFICKRFLAFKQGKPIDSFWRMA